MIEYIVLEFVGRYGLAVYTHQPSGEKIESFRGMPYDSWVRVVGDFMANHADVPVVDSRNVVLGLSTTWIKGKK